MDWNKNQIKKLWKAFKFAFNSSDKKDKVASIHGIVAALDFLILASGMGSFLFRTLCLILFVYFLSSFVAYANNKEDL